MNPDLSLPPKFSGAAQLQLYARYGDPQAEGFTEKWITAWDVRMAFPWFPKRRILVHKHFRTVLDTVFRALEMKGLHTEIKTLDEAFSIRYVRGSRIVLSTHSWGCAVDMNAAQNPLAGEGAWSEAFLEAMSASEIFCGQRWTGRKAPMHFAMVNG